MAALLACGDGAALSYQSAAALWGLRQCAITPVAVTLESQRGRKQHGIEVHRARLPRHDTMLVDGLRVTTPARTIVDLAATTHGRAMREVVERAQDLRRFHANEIRAVLGGRRGTRALAQLVTLYDPDRDNARSHLERLFLTVVRRAKLPRPEVNLPIADKRRDFVWAAQRLVVEVDGYQWHSTRAAQRRDRRRDRQLTVLGWRPARFTYEEVAFEPGVVTRDLAALLES